MELIPEALVPRWSPQIVISEGVRSTSLLEQFGWRAPAKYVAPAITVGAPEPLLVAGSSFAVLSGARGLDKGSIHTLGHVDWARLFVGLSQFAGRGERAIVAAHHTHFNYYHWLVQSLATVAVLTARGEGPLLLPEAMAPWQAESLGLIPAAATLTLAADTMAVLPAGRLTNLASGDFAFAPHPVAMGALAGLGPEMRRAEGGPERVYFSRLPGGERRRMVNEATLAEALAARGFAIVQPGELSVAEQMAIVRSARVVVAPHGAALTNLVWTADGSAGPRVVELFQEDYLNLCFLKIAQCKRLDYAALVGRCIERAANRHFSTWEADIDSLLRLIDQD